MRRFKAALIFICFILFFSVFVLWKDANQNQSPEITYGTEFEHNYFTIKKQIQKKYAITSSHIKIIHKERLDPISFVLFSFMDESHHYIGQLSYVDEYPMNNCIPSEKIHALKIHSLKDTTTPFKLMTSMVALDHVNYCFYYGWVNDHSITKIKLDFTDENFEVFPNEQKLFYLLRNKNMNLNKTTALDSNSLVIQEYIY